MLNNMLEARLEELLPHESDLCVALLHPTEHLFPFKFKVLILDRTGWQQAYSLKSYS